MKIYRIKTNNFEEYYANKETAQKIRDEWNAEVCANEDNDYITIEEITVIED